jgi:hypothetical protein
VIDPISSASECVVKKRRDHAPGDLLRATRRPPRDGLDRKDPHCGEVASKSIEIVQIRGQHDVTARSCRSHDDRINRRSAAHGCNGLTGDARELLRERLDVHECENGFTAIRAASPPFRDDVRGDDRDDPLLPSPEKELFSPPAGTTRFATAFLSVREDSPEPGPGRSCPSTSRFRPLATRSCASR